ncbi:cytochrome c oxidase subunit 3 [Tranquillimonas alkanivorans]|uniref:cytochrome-c oxidase n=1 Tax=Tranquillimonas alkanivorans TaxID=441119 RepID=A0A1I5VMC6_9RHOB|nr:cytochrome c oxidase subunit 3 [Tranquillimonas alkanivorans]SFQ08437.1 Heme/copper-type cytochrome/quinol oxidase, subunit 3 [Tranquillimonas alkanivorans]
MTKDIPVEVAVDASDITRFAPHTHPLWWGILAAVAIEAAVVANLLTSYFYLWARTDAWPPEGVEPPPLLWPTLILVVLPLSSVTMWWAGKGSDAGRMRQLALGVSASVLLACVAIGFRSIQIAQFDILWSDHAYGSILWAITGFHYTHVVSAIVGTAAVAILAWMGYFTPERQLGVVVDTLYWYFVAGVYLPIYLVLYWAPRLL